MELEKEPRYGNSSGFSAEKQVDCLAKCSLDVFKRITRPLYVIVKFVLPELLTSAFEEFIGCMLFEGIHEGQHVASVGCARTKKVQVVGHGAVGVDGK